MEAAIDKLAESELAGRLPAVDAAGRGIGSGLDHIAAREALQLELERLSKEILALARRVNEIRPQPSDYLGVANPGLACDRQDDRHRRRRQAIFAAGDQLWQLAGELAEERRFLIERQ